MTGSAVGRIRTRSTFRALGRPAGRATRGPIRVSFSSIPESNEDVFPQVAYAISRQHGNAVLRNRLRRRLRAAAREVAAEVPNGAYLIRPSAAAAAMPYRALVDTLRAAMAAAEPANVPPAAEKRPQ